jgi:hypothetical protein
VFASRLALLPAALAAGLLLSGTALAQGSAPRTLTFKELNKGSTFAFIDNAPKWKGHGEPSASPGDTIVFTNPLVDSAGKRLGSLYVHCTAMGASQSAFNATYACDGSVALDDGTLSLQVLMFGAGHVVHAPITGGTGAYANVRGFVVSKPTKSGATDTVTLAG